MASRLHFGKRKQSYTLYRGQNVPSYSSVLCRGCSGRGLCHNQKIISADRKNIQRRDGNFRLRRLALASLLSQLLFFTRLEQGTENYQRSSLNLSDLINTVCDDRRILLTPAQSLDTDVEENVFIDGNSDLLYRLLSNLLDNAYKYSGEEACVIVTLKAQNGVAKLSVSDNGIGISPENLDKIWNRFYREDSSRSSDESFGLGLAMVKQISDFHGATVEAHSEQGRGSTFTFSVPFSLRQQK